MKSLACKAALEHDVQTAIERLQSRGRIDVHAVRKSIKHARSIVRLWANELSHASYQRINLGLRDAARPLAPTRDADVLIAVIERLRRKHGVTSLRPLHAALIHEQRKSRRAGTPPRQIALAKRRLDTLSRAVAKLEATDADWAGITAAVGDTYRRARKAARRARTDPTSEHLHDWRKQVKYLWHHVQFLAPLAPQPLHRLADDLHRLADHLGDHHDLALLAARIEAGQEIAEEDRKTVKGLLDRGRARLERKAFRLGQRLLDAKPKAFERKLRRRSKQLRDQPTTPSA